MFADKLLEYIADFLSYMYSRASELSDYDLMMLDHLNAAVEQNDLFQISRLDLSYFESYMETCNDEIVYTKWRVAREFLA